MCRSLSGLPMSGLEQLLVNERVQPGHATITLFEEVRSRVVERLTWHPASPPASRHIVHGLDLTRDRVAVISEVFANLGRRIIDTLAADNMTAGMNPKTIVGVRFREQCQAL